MSPDDPDAFRRAIHSMSNYYNTLGIYRPNFIRADNDAMARNAYFALIEKSFCDYFGTLEWKIIDSNKKVLKEPMGDLEYPNPQDSFSDIIRMTVPDLLRYDAAAIVKSYKTNGTLGELKAYDGPEFWKEIDRVPIGASMGDQTKMVGYWSHGYTQRFWQRSRTGIYISYEPDEVCYMMMYPSSDNIYGTDYITTLKWQIQYLIDSTRAAGRTFANGVVPSLVWNHPQVLDRTTLTQRIAEVERENKGAYKFGAIMHTVRDEKVETLSHTLHDMEWLEGQKFIGQIVWSMFGFQPQEFGSEGSNRASAYISRNVTKSKMLYPLMRYYEIVINKQILPHLKGYQKGWKFQFEREIDLDDQMKQAEVSLQRANTYTMLTSAGIEPTSALTLSGLVEDPEDVKIAFTPMDMKRMEQKQLQLKQAGTGIHGADGTLHDAQGDVKKTVKTDASHTERSPGSRPPKANDKSAISSEKYRAGVR